MLSKLLLFFICTLTNVFSQWDRATPSQIAPQRPTEETPDQQGETINNVRWTAGKLPPKPTQPTPVETGAEQAFIPSRAATQNIQTGGANLAPDARQQIAERLENFEKILDVLTDLSALIPERFRDFQQSRSNIQTLTSGFLSLKASVLSKGNIVNWEQEAWNSIIGGLKMTFAPILKDAYFVCEEMRQSKRKALASSSQKRAKKIASDTLKKLEAITQDLEDADFTQKTIPILPGHLQLFLGYASAFYGRFLILKNTLGE